MVEDCTGLKNGGRLHWREGWWKAALARIVEDCTVLKDGGRLHWREGWWKTALAGRKVEDCTGGKDGRRLHQRVSRESVMVFKTDQGDKFSSNKDSCDTILFLPSL